MGFFLRLKKWLGQYFLVRMDTDRSGSKPGEYRDGAIAQRYGRQALPVPRRDASDDHPRETNPASVAWRFLTPKD